MSVAFLFPGQGAQFVGMLSAYRNVPCVRSAVEEASDILNKDMWSLIEHGPMDVLSLTENTQPAMLLADVALWRVFLHEGMIDKESDVWLAGHSLGEYAALVAAQSLSFEDALRIVSYRARVMQEAIPTGKGSMAAVLGMPAEKIVEICKRLSTPYAVVEAANFNSSMQTVIGGHTEAVEKSILEIKNNGAKQVILLDVSVPSHTSLMNSACEQMCSFLEEIDFSRPIYPVIHNLTADVCFDTSGIRKILVGQLSSPVRWVDTISFLLDQSVRRFVQCGPGSVMPGLLRKIPDIEVLLSSDYCRVF